MATPTDQGQTPPMEMDVTKKDYEAHSGHGSIGPVIGVVSVIIVLGVIASMIGRLCSGRRVFGRGQYDAESWVEKKCSLCLDGRLDPPPQLRPISENIPVAEPVENPHREHQESQLPNSRQK